MRTILFVRTVFFLRTVLFVRATLLHVVRTLAAFASNLGHMLAVRTYCLAALASGFPSFLGIKLVGSSFFMDRLSALACDLALLLVVHRSKTPIRSVFFRHDSIPPFGNIGIERSHDQW